MMKLPNFSSLPKTLTCALVLALAGCATPPPRDHTDVCRIFEQNEDWYEDAKDMRKRWGTPMSLAMAMVKHESSFVHDARPPKDYFLGIIPWGNISSAYGYSQALDGTWDDYQRATGDGGSRTDFGDSLQFIGWYTAASKRELGIPYSDAYSHYLAYHEGRGGYKKGSYKSKPGLKKVATRVNNLAKKYRAQLLRCTPALEKKHSSWFF